MIIYNQSSTFKKYLNGILMGLLIIPAIVLFIQGFILFGVLLTIVYLVIETSRTGVDFNFEKSHFSKFREVLFFIKIRQKESTPLDSFSHYKVKAQIDDTTVRANFVQSAMVSQDHYSLELFDKQKDEFLQIVKSDTRKLQPLLIRLEEQNIISAD